MTDRQWVFGIHAVTALLRNQNRQVFNLYLDRKKNEKNMQSIVDLARQRSIQILPLQMMDKTIDQGNHQGVVALVAKLPEFQENDIPLLLDQAGDQALILILDSITDVHNLGACLRSADAAGVNFVILPKDKSATINATVSKVASGAAETVPVARVTNLARAMSRLREAGVWIYGAAGEGDKSLYELDFRGHVALVMGSEGKGLRRLTRENCDDLYRIPMHGYVDSLNVSVAAGVSLYEVVRQRLR